MDIIDAHLHFRTDIEGFSQTAENAGHSNSAEHLASVWEENHIIHGIVMGNLSVNVSDHNYPKNMSYCIGIDSHCLNHETYFDKKYYLESVKNNLEQKNCVGLKLYPGYCPYYIYDEIYHPFFELAQKYNKPVAVHTGETSKSDAFLKYSHPLTLDTAAAMFPDVNFVMCHFGNPWLCDAAAVLSKNPNVACDLSGILVGNPDMDTFFTENKNYIQYFKMWLSYVNDYDRIMFGTDWPIINIPKYIAFISELIPKKHHEKVFYHTAKKIYSI